MISDLRKYFKLMSEFGIKNLRVIVIGMILGLFAQFCILIIPFLTRFIIDTVILQKHMELFINVIFVACVILLVLLGSSISANYILYRAFAEMGVKLKTKLFNTIQFASFEFFIKTPPGEITYRIFNDSDTVLNSWLYLLAIIPIQLFLLMAGAIMVLWNEYLAFFVFGIIIIQSFLIIKFRKPLFKYALLVKQKEQEATGYATERLSKIQLIRSLSMEEKEGKIFSEKLLDFIKISIRRYFIEQLSSSSTLVINNLWAVVILWYGGTQVVAGSMTLGTLMAFLLLANILNQPITVIVNFLFTFQDVRASLNRLIEYLLVKPYITLAETKCENTQPFKGDISVINCSFGYSPEQSILKNINLEIPSKSIFAIVGPSGAGKTTLCRMLVRFYDPWKGKILIDGKDIREISLNFLRKNIQMTLQGNYVLSGSIKENITYGIDPFPSKDQISRATKKAAIDFIDRLPFGYLTPISDGFKLSAGEAQRIALCRAFLSSARIFILDEPTSFIDVTTEELIKASLLRLKEEMTIILIAHRLSTVMIADTLVLLNNGQIIETGNPSELILKDTAFKRMHTSILTS
jgi:ATP-binding cassette subfamily B protein